MHDVTVMTLQLDVTLVSIGKHLPTWAQNTEGVCRKHARPGRPASLRIYEAHVGMSSEEQAVATYSYFRDKVRMGCMGQHGLLVRLHGLGTDCCISPQHVCALYIQTSRELIPSVPGLRALA